MDHRRHRIFLTTLCLTSLFVAVGAYADDALPTRQSPPVEPNLHRQAINEAKIDTENFEVGAFFGLMSIEDFGHSSVKGVRAAYHINPDFFIEGAYGTATAGKTSYELLSGSAQLLTDDERQLSYYNLSLGYNLLPSEAFVGHRYAFNADLYVIGGIGSTRFAADDHYTVNFGAGYRFVATDWLALHADVRDHMFATEVTGINKTTHNVELSAGVTVFF